MTNNLTTTTLAPINEEELALNLHRDPMGRDEAKMRNLLMDNGTDEMGQERGSWEAYRDLGGSFILPLLKERKYDNRSIPLVYSGKAEAREWHSLTFNSRSLKS